MTNPPAASEANTVSQEEEEVIGRVYTVPLDVGGMAVGDIALDNEPPIGPEIFSPQAASISPASRIPARTMGITVLADARSRNTAMRLSTSSSSSELILLVL